MVSEDIRTDSTGMLVLVSEKAQVIRTNLGEIRSTGRIAQGVKIQVPDAGDKISAIRVINERRETGAVLDPTELENDSEYDESDGENEAPDESTDELEVATED